MASATRQEAMRINDLDFYTKTTFPPEGTQTIAKLFFLHGFSEHIDRYDELFGYLASRGIETFAFDQRGEGHTSPHKKDWGVTEEKLVFKDLDSLIENRVGPDVNSNGTPWFLLGHSMGGGICLNYAIKGTHRDWFAGYIASAPLILLHPRTRPSAVLYHVLYGISKVFPHFQYDTGLECEYLSHDEAVVQAVKDDPMCPGICTLKQMSDMLDRGRRLLDPKYYAAIVDRPVLILHGDGDEINFYGGSKEFIDRIPIKDKKLVTIEGGYHDLSHEIEKHRHIFFYELAKWINEKSVKAKL